MTPYQAFVIAALSVILTAVLSLAGYFVRKISSHDTALAVLVTQVNPPGDKSLRQVLREIQIEQAVQKESVKRLESATLITPHHDT